MRISILRYASLIMHGRFFNSLLLEIPFKFLDSHFLSFYRLVCISVLSQQYYTPCATSSLYELNLIPIFESTSYQLSLHFLHHRENGLRLRSTVSLVSTGARLFEGHAAYISSNKEDGRCRRLIHSTGFGRAGRASRRRRSCAQPAPTRHRKTPSPPVERNSGSGPSARISSILKTRQSTTSFVTTTRNRICIAC